MTHLEVRQKYSPARRIFNFLLGVSSGDETLHLMLDILLPLSLVIFLMLRPIWVWGKPLARMCPSFGHLLVAPCEMDRVIACWDKELFSDHGKGPFFELIYKSTLIKCWTVSLALYHSLRPSLYVETSRLQGSPACPSYSVRATTTKRSELFSWETKSWLGSHFGENTLVRPAGWTRSLRWDNQSTREWCFR